MERAILKYKNGEIDFDKFAKETRLYWLKTATFMLGKWDHPEALEPEDLVQEMMLEAWLKLQKLDFKKTKSPKKWVVIGVVQKTRRVLHIQRRANDFARNHRSKDPRGRFDISVGSDLGDQRNAWADAQEENWTEQEAAIGRSQLKKLPRKWTDEVILDAALTSLTDDEAISKVAQRLHNEWDECRTKKSLNKEKADLSSRDFSIARKMYKHSMQRMTTLAATL